MMKVSISKSVGRAFDVMEIFRETRTPASATTIRRKLDCPHSSVVAVLHNLADLGYLSYDETTRLYFPTKKLSVLGTWVQPALRGSSRLRELTEAISRETGHSTAISCRNSIFLNIVLVRRGPHPRSAVFSPGIGVSLGRSIPGLAILSQLGDEVIEEIVGNINKWSDKAKAEQRCTLEQTMALVQQVRACGAAIGYDWSFPDTGAIAYPMTSPFDGAPLALSVTGPTKLVKPQERVIREMIEHYSALHAACAPSPWPRYARQPEGRDAAFPMRYRPGTERSAASV